MEEIVDKEEGPTFTLKKLNLQGHLEVAFNENLAIPGNLDEINGDVIEINLLRDDSNMNTDETNFKFSWFVKSYEARKMII